VSPEIVNGLAQFAAIYCSSFKNDRVLFYGDCETDEDESLFLGDTF
jgi:hypothetical protein